MDYGEGSYCAESRAEGSSVGASYSVGRRIALRKSELRPYGSVMVGEVKQKSYSERGAGGAGLNVGEQKREQLRVGVGVEWEREVGGRVSGERRGQVAVQLGVAQELRGGGREIEVALQGNSGEKRRVRGSEAGKSVVELGGSLSAAVSRRSRVYLRAQGELRENSTSLYTTLGLHCCF